MRGWLAIAEEGAIGFAAATLARSQLAGIGAGIAFYFGETVAGVFLPKIVQYFPFTAAGAAVESTLERGGGPPAAAQLPPDTALLVVALWLIDALVVAALFTERAEVTG